MGQVSDAHGVVCPNLAGLAPIRRSTGRKLVRLAPRRDQGTRTTHAQVARLVALRPDQAICTCRRVVPLMHALGQHQSARRL